jgi:hypothetical protein
MFLTGSSKKRTAHIDLINAYCTGVGGSEAFDLRVIIDAQNRTSAVNVLALFGKSFLELRNCVCSAALWRKSRWKFSAHFRFHFSRANRAAVIHQIDAHLMQKGLPVSIETLPAHGPMTNSEKQVIAFAVCSQRVLNWFGSRRLVEGGTPGALLQRSKLRPPHTDTSGVSAQISQCANDKPIP